MPHQAPLQPGDPRRVGRYRLAGRIAGIPADGPIYLGTGPDGHEVMISMLRSEWASDGAARDRFAAEAAVARRVPPFCAARILDAGLDAAGAYLVSEYVPGKSLLEVVLNEGVLAEAAIEAAAIGMATGLASVHQAGLVHGNFGPEFVIMTGSGPRVVEFGITPPYGTATPSADMVAWAQTVVFAASGRPPVAMADLEVLPYYVRDLVTDCLNPDPSGRPSARAAVLELIGEHDPPAGVLAEGSRRAVPGADYARRQRPAGPARPPARTGSTGPTAAAGRRSPAGLTGPGPVSRHGRGAEDGDPRTAAHPGPHPDRHGAHERRGRWRRTAPLLGGIVVVGVLATLGVIQLLSGGKSPPRAVPEVADSSAGGQRSPLTSEPVTPDVTTPAAFAGRWTGEVRQPPNDTIAVTLHLTKGSTTGTVSYAPTGVSACSATLSLTRASARKLTLSQEAIQGPSCSAGTVTMTLTSSGSVLYTFQGSGPAATGTLTRS
jgi:hypothetical protein